MSLIRRSSAGSAGAQHPPRAVPLRLEATVSATTTATNAAKIRSSIWSPFVPQPTSDEGKRAFHEQVCAALLPDLEGDDQHDDDPEGEAPAA